MGNRHLAKYTVAKYAADVKRMEPVNIGVIMWTNGHVAAKFLPEDKAALIVSEPDIYSRWVTYWTGILEKGVVENRARESWRKNRPNFLTAFEMHNEGQLYTRLRW